MDLWEALAHPCHKVQRLLKLATGWDGAAAEAVEAPPAAGFQPLQKPPFDEFIGEAEVAKLITRFRTGTSRQDLAKHYGYSVSSVGRLLRQRGVRVRSQS